MNSAKDELEKVAFRAYIATLSNNTSLLTYRDASDSVPLSTALEICERLEAERDRLSGKVGNLNQQIKQIKSGWESEGKYKQVAHSRMGDRRALMRIMMKQKAALEKARGLLERAAGIIVHYDGDDLDRDKLNVWLAEYRAL